MSARPIRIAAAVLALALVPTAAFAKDSLHGKWTTTVTADDDAKEQADTVEFTNGDQLSSERMKKDGFEPATYTGRSALVGSAETFEATLKNKAGDEAKWTGQVLGGELTGTLEITKKDGTKSSYSFKGKRK